MKSYRIAVTAAALAAAVATGCRTVPLEPDYATLISHRGESKDAPENTLSAFKTAVERGFGFECDIYLSKDKRLFTFHDATLTRTTGGANTNACIDVDWRTLSSLNVGGWGKWKGSGFDPERPALLEEVLALARPGRKIYVEIKGDDATWVPYVKKVFDRLDVSPDEVLFISFGENVCRALKRSMPRFKTYWLTGSKRVAKGYLSSSCEEIIAVLDDLGVDGLDIRYDPERVTPEFIAKVRDAGYEVHVWTVDDVKKARAAFAAGAMSVTTNRALGLLKEHREGGAQ